METIWKRKQRRNLTYHREQVNSQRLSKLPGTLYPATQVCSARINVLKTGGIVPTSGLKVTQAFRLVKPFYAVARRDGMISDNVNNSRTFSRYVNFHSGEMF